MKTIQRFIYAGFATCALASASMPAFSWTVWPDVDFEWYANVGKPVAGTTVEVYPAPRAGYTWAPGHYEVIGTRQVYVPGVWVPHVTSAPRKDGSAGRSLLSRPRSTGVLRSCAHASARLRSLAIKTWSCSNESMTCRAASAKWRSSDGR